MSGGNSALASLTATYTDSDNEDDIREDISPESESSDNSQVYKTTQVTPVKTPEKTRRAKSLRLVSYNDDAVVSDDEDGDVASIHVEQSYNMDVPENEEASNEPEKNTDTKKYEHYGFHLPAEPKGKPPQELVDKIKNLYAKMETNNMDMNKIIQERKEFRNPSIYEKLIQFCDINEFGTNYPPEIYDPLKWGPESYYEELAKAQKSEMVKRQKERKDNDKVEQATAAARKVEEEAKKRKSKWDQPAPVKPVVAPALTTTVTGTKGTVISAFGSLPKKSNA